MKPALSFLFIACLAAAAAGAQGAPPVVEVRLDDPARFTDFRIDRFGGTRSSARLAAELREWIEREAARHLPAGTRLQVTITDVDMAGELEPWRSTGLADVRIVRDIYPSRIDLAFTLSDESGKVVKEGQRKLASGLLSSEVLRGGDGPLLHEKALLRRWLAREFPAARRALE